SPGKHRIFIIDEVHMLSTAAFNALLKTLEEPPARSLFIFATTDPQKIPTTVLSRVQRFDLRRLSNAELLALLRKICSADGIEAPEPVLRAIAREADGSGRDALTLLDRLTSALGAKLELAAAIAILDVIDRKLLLGVLEPVLGRDPAAALAALGRALEQGIDPVRFAGDLLTEIRDLVVAKLVDDPAGLIDVAPDALAETRARAAPHDAETLQRLFRVLITRLAELGTSARPEHALEMAVVRLATLPAAESLAALLQRLDALDPGGSGPAPGAPGPGSPGGGAGPRGPQRSTAAPAPGPAPKPPSAPPARAESLAPAPPAPARARPLQAAPEEPPLPDDADFAVASPEEPAPAPSGPALSFEQRSALEAKVRADAKAHPRVREVIEALDAELREIRVERAP
ncbi:MAG TPA: AAA family ATPase, partial [Myxococcota bacterium]|nr:AAA family ATPase [Myxococcota bacterium]